MQITITFATERERRKRQWEKEKTEARENCFVSLFLLNSCLFPGLLLLLLSCEISSGSLVVLALVSSRICTFSYQPTPKPPTQRRGEWWSSAPIAGRCSVSDEAEEKKRREKKKRVTNSVNGSVLCCFFFLPRRPTFHLFFSRVLLFFISFPFSYFDWWLSRPHNLMQLHPGILFVGQESTAFLLTTAPLEMAHYEQRKKK